MAPGVDDFFVDQICQLRAQNFAHSRAYLDQSANSARRLIRQIENWRERCACADRDGAIVQREGVFLHIIWHDDRFSGDSRREVGFYRAVDSFRQFSDCIAQRAGEITSIRNKRRLVAAVHRASIGHVAEHHVRVAREVFVDAKACAFVIHVVRRILPSRSARLLSVLQPAEKHDVARHLGIGVLLERSIREPDCAKEIHFVSEISAEMRVRFVQRSL